MWEFRVLYVGGRFGNTTHLPTYSVGGSDYTAYPAAVLGVGGRLGVRHAWVW